MTGWQGRYFEDFTEGEQIQHGWARTVTKGDKHLFTLLTCNSDMTHTNDVYAAETEVGKPLVNSTSTLSLVTGLTVRDISENAVANLGWESVEILGPVFVGDTLYASSEVLACRGSKSRPEAGIVSVRTTGYRQDGNPVLSFARTVMVHRRGHGPRAAWPNLETR